MCLSKKLVRINGSWQAVACGQCQECKKQRQNDVAHRLYRQSNFMPRMHFWTLTYADENLPYYWKATDAFLERIGALVTVQHVNAPINDIDTLTALVAYDPDQAGTLIIKKHYDWNKCYKGPYSLLGEYETSLSPEFVSELRSKFRENKYKPLVVRKVSTVTNDTLLGEFTIAPSLRNSDVTSWIKKFRGGDGHSLRFNFKYYCCGEYGPRTDRPHYHMVTYGLSASQVAAMKDEWQSRFGFCSVSQVETTPRDGQSHAAKASRYVGKYVSKGKFESSNVTNGFVVKPRSFSSKDMLQVTRQEFEHYTGADILSTFVDLYRLSDEYLSLPVDVREFREQKGIHMFLPDEYYTADVLQRISDRCFYTIAGSDSKYRYKLGKSMLSALFKYRDDEVIPHYIYTVNKNNELKKVIDYEQTKRRILSTPLSLALSAFARGRAAQLLSDEYAEFETHEIPADSTWIAEFRKVKRQAVQDRAKSVDEAYLRQLRKSFC